MTDQAIFQVQNADRALAIIASGEIDIANVDQFRSFVTEAVRQDSRPVIISLEKVSYLDSHTLEVIIEISKRLATNRRRLAVVAPRENPAGRILRISNLDLAISLFETMDEALHSLR